MPKKIKKNNLTEKKNDTELSENESNISETEQNYDDTDIQEDDENDDENDDEMQSNDDDIIQSGIDEDDEGLQNEELQYDLNLIDDGINKTYLLEEKIVDNKDRITFNRMTKYELVRIIGTRRKQLVMGAKPLVKNTENLTEQEIAIEELKNKMIPFIISRHCPNGNIEEWKANELSYDHLVNILH